MRDVQTTSGDASAKRSQRHQPILSIRARLIVLALLAIVPPMLERVHSLGRARADRAELVRSQLIDLARSGEAAQREIVDAVRALLGVVARTYERMPLYAPVCNRSLAELTAKVPWIGGLGIAGTDGSLICATDPRAIGLNISDRPYFQEALRSHEFVLSDYLINRVQHAPGLMAAFPITMLRNDEGTTTAIGFDNVRRIFAYVRVPRTRARLAVGLDESVVHSGIDREISIAYVQLALFGMLVLVIAWFGGERLIVRPIRALARTAARFGRGDLHVRASDEPWLAEFQPLAAALDDMAHKLAGREEELRVANQDLDALASLDGLTGLANRRGFDRELEHAWQRAGESREPLALMTIDIDHFKLFNDRYGHVGGDTCLRAVAETLRWCSSTKPCWSRAMAAKSLPCCCRASTSGGQPHSPTGRAARSKTCSSPIPTHRADTSPSVSASNPGCRRPANRRPIWSRRLIARSTRQSGAGATRWSRMLRW
jgi:Diguanylate cyclase, GGDEF domain/HAMP domain